MAKRAAEESRNVTVRPFMQRGYGKLALVLCSVVLLTLALAPANQFYLAWVGLVPWLWVVRDARTTRRAFAWSWLAGTAFFGLNLWWLIYVTVPGAIVLVVYLGLYWGLAALLVRRWIRRDQVTAYAPRTLLMLVLGFAAVWAGIEFIRGNFFTGLPWLYLGHTQSPILLACQISDIFGVYGISFCVAAVNALLFLYLTVADRKPLRLAAAMVGGLWLASCIYGAFRLNPLAMSAEHVTVLIVQPNEPQSNKGEKGASVADRLRFHLDATEAGVRAAAKAGRHVDLVCWSETVAPGLNEEYRRELHGARALDEHGNVIDPDVGASLDEIVLRVGEMCRRLDISLLTGGEYQADLRDPQHFLFADRRNSAYLFGTDGNLATERYDKIHLVPFGEFIPFKHSHWLHWLYTFFNSFSPYDFDYTLTPGPENAPTVFTIPPPPRDQAPVRFVAPICFEDIDSRLVAKMFRGDGQKRADLIVNLTNDGWFKANENPQHLQAAIFRSIENRVPTARSVNTGISALIDSCGRVIERVPQGKAGTAVGTLRLDPRYTLYSRWGDWFGGMCGVLTAAVAAWRTERSWRTRGKRRS